MHVMFFNDAFKTVTEKSLFGLCDDEIQKSSYIDETNPLKWIAIVKNDTQKSVSFYPLDKRLTLIRQDGKPDKICDCFKKAYIANSRRPNFNSDDIPRIKRFSNETGYILHIVRTIDIL